MYIQTFKKIISYIQNKIKNYIIVSFQFKSLYVILGPFFTQVLFIRFTLK